MNSNHSNDNPNGRAVSASPRSNPPAHLPVLTEVVQLAGEGGLGVGEMDAVPAAPMARAAEPSPPVLNDAVAIIDVPLLIEDRPVPHWLLRRQDEAALPQPAGPLGGTDFPGLHPADGVPQDELSPAQAQRAVAVTELRPQGRAAPNPHPPGDMRGGTAEPVRLMRPPAQPEPEPATEPSVPDHYIPDDSPTFSASWWMNHEFGAEPPSVVPAIVSAVEGVAAGQPRPQHPTDIPRPAPLASVSEEQLVLRVMSDLDRQVGMMFEHRMHEVIVPAFARATDALLKELREEVSASLRDMVIRAVAIELARYSRSSGDG